MGMSKPSQEKEKEEEAPTIINSQQWVLKARPSEADDLDPKSIFSKQSQQLATLQDGQVLAKVLYISVDPINLGWITQDTFDIPAVKIGDPVRAMGIAQVIKSKHKHYQEGEIVNGLVGWQQHVIFNPDDKDRLMNFFKPPDNMSFDTCICMPSALTAYYGINDKAKVRSNDAVLISAAAGATGLVAGQVAKILGAKTVVGLVNSPQQSQWLLASACRFDAAIDIGSENLDQRLQELFPKGVNVFFDTVGGELLNNVVSHLAHRARIVLCGATSQYNKQKPCGLLNSMSLTAKSATVYCFMLHDYKGQFIQGILTLSLWIKFKRLVLKVAQDEGFECIPSTLIRLVNDPTVTGQQVVKLADPPLHIHTDWWYKAITRGLTVVSFVLMMDKLVNTVEERAENMAIDKVSHEVETQAQKEKSKQKKSKS